jgi:CRP-like cAMP-binding protein
LSDRRRTPLYIEVIDPQHCTPEVRRQILTEVSFFSDLKPAELEAVDRRARSVGFTAGEWFVIATGVVKTTRLSAEGMHTTTGLLGPGDFCGVLPALGFDAYQESAQALSGACLLAFGIADFNWVLGRYPSVSRAALSAVSLRLAATQDALFRIGGTVEQRTASVLLELADKLGVRRRTGVLVQTPLSREDLADLVGARTETVSRLLSRWRRQGLVETGRRWVAVVDPDALAEFAV